MHHFYEIERETERESQRERHRETQRERHTDRQRQRDRERVTERERDRERERGALKVVFFNLAWKEGGKREAGIIGRDLNNVPVGQWQPLFSFVTLARCLVTSYSENALGNNFQFSY